jgi:trehalose 6-phosphate phosphatase
MGLPPDLAGALGRFCSEPVVLVGSDFDGVLAPFVDDPMQARALEGTIDALADLADVPDTYAAVVSGRDLDALTELTGLAHASPVTRIGSHGAQSSRQTRADLGPEEQALLAELTRDLEGVVAQHPTARLEYKPQATVLHTRGADPEQAHAATREALEVAARHTGVNVLEGKQVVEMSVVSADKGTALLGLARAVRADAVAYFGDDVTDEHAFRAMGPRDLSVKVGPGDTAARFRVSEPQDVAEALSEIVRLRGTRR